MILAYYSRTGNTADFLDWYFPEYEKRNIEAWDADKTFVLFTPTYDFGDVPEEVTEWLGTLSAKQLGGSIPDYNSSLMAAVVASGNRNFGNFFGESGDKLEAKYGVPLLMKYELKGNPQVAELVKERMSEVL